MTPNEVYSALNENRSLITPVEPIENSGSHLNRSITLIIPILMGRAEAWRRFLQELQGSRQAEFRGWCCRNRLQVHDIRLHDALGGSMIMVKCATVDQSQGIPALTDMTHAFDRWFVTQIKRLHGLDLTAIANEKGASYSFGIGNY